MKAILFSSIISLFLFTRILHSETPSDSKLQDAVKEFRRIEYPDNKRSNDVKDTKTILEVKGGGHLYRTKALELLLLAANHEFEKIENSKGTEAEKDSMVLDLCYRLETAAAIQTNIILVSAQKGARDESVKEKLKSNDNH